MQAIVIFTTAPDEDVANRLAHLLVDKGLAACVQIGVHSRSIYKWQSTLESVDEIPLTIKTLPHRVDAVQAMLQQEHPYEVPEVLVLTASSSEAYFNWMEKELNA